MSTPSSVAVIGDGANSTPELLDLREHEKVIERGLASFIDVGCALVAIKADRKYRHAGYSTFEDYCRDRWSIGSSHRQRLMTAAVTAEALLQSSPMGELPTPQTERQVRPLTLLKSDDDKREAWAEAVTEADGGQPTAVQVERAVERRQPRVKTADELAAEDDYFRAEARRKFNSAVGNSLSALAVLADNPDKLSDFVANYEAPATPLTTDDIKGVGRAIDQMINEWRYP